MHTQGQRKAEAGRHWAAHGLRRQQGDISNSEGFLPSEGTRHGPRAALKVSGASRNASARGEVRQS